MKHTSHVAKLLVWAGGWSWCGVILEQGDSDPRAVIFFVNNLSAILIIVEVLYHLHLSFTGRCSNVLMVKKDKRILYFVSYVHLMKSNQ